MFLHPIEDTKMTMGVTSEPQRAQRFDNKIPLLFVQYLVTPILCQYQEGIYVKELIGSSKKITVGL